MNTVPKSNFLQKAFLNHYGLTDQPFGFTPDPRYLYFGPTHREAIASLLYGIDTGCGFLTLIAPPGTGKTTLLLHLLDRLRDTAQTVFLFQTQCSSREFFRYLLRDLGVDAAPQELDQMHEVLNSALLKSARQGKRFVLVIDEAQNLEDSVLETVRLLSDFETPQSKLMQIVLAGQTQLADRLTHPNLTQLRQRISIVSKLHPLSSEEVLLYIDHRLRIAGYSGPPLFEYGALALIMGGCGGIPRNVNNVCFNALTLGYAKGQNRIDASIVREALADLDLEAAGTKASKERLLATSEGAVPGPPDESHLQSSFGGLRAAHLSQWGERSTADGSQTSVGPFFSPTGTVSADDHYATGSIVEINSRSAAASPSRDSQGVLTNAPAFNSSESFVQKPAQDSMAVPVGSNPTEVSEKSEFSGESIGFGGPIGQPSTSAKNISASESATELKNPSSSLLSEWWTRVGAVCAVLILFFGSLVLYFHHSSTKANESKVPQQITESRSSTDPYRPVTIATASSNSYVEPDRQIQVQAAIKQPGKSKPALNLFGSLNARPFVKSTSSAGNGAVPTIEEEQELSELSKTITAITPPLVPTAPPSVPLQINENPVQVGGRVREPRPVSRVLPQYPQLARDSGTQGEVVIRVVVDKGGKVTDSKVVSGPFALRQAAIDAVNQWRYEPSTLDGQAVSVQMFVRVLFKL